MTPKADGGGGGDSDGSWDGRPLSPIGLAGTAGSESARRLARHAARVEKLKSQQLAEVYYNLAQLLGMRNGATDPELVGLLQAALEIKPSYHRAQQTLDHVMAETGAGINSN